MMVSCFEEVKNAKGVLYKLKGKLSDNKEASITLVPRTKLVYMQINDNSNAYQNGTFDKTKSTFVSLSLPEAYTLCTMMSSMDLKIADLINNASRPSAQGKKKNQNDANAAEQLLVDFNQFQGENPNGSQPAMQQMYQMQPSFNNFQQPAQQYMT